MLESSTPLQPMGFMLVVFQLITTGNIQDDKPVHVECHEGKVRTGVLTYSESAYTDFLERAQQAETLKEWEKSPAFMVSYSICDMISWPINTDNMHAHSIYSYKGTPRAVPLLRERMPWAALSTSPPCHSACE